MTTIAAKMSQFEHYGDESGDPQGMHYMHQCEQFILEIRRASSAMDTLDLDMVDTSTSFKVSNLRARYMDLVVVATTLLNGCSPADKDLLLEDELFGSPAHKKKVTRSPGVELGSPTKKAHKHEDDEDLFE